MRIACLTNPLAQAVLTALWGLLLAGNCAAAPIFTTELDPALQHTAPVPEGGHLERFAAGIAGLPIDGTVEQSATGAVTLNGISVGVNVFELNAVQLVAATSITINMPIGAKSIVRVAGPLPALESLELAARSRVNTLVGVEYPELGTGELAQTQFTISRLAPVTIVNANREGVLFANALNDAALEFAATHNYVYTRLAVPEPPSFALLLAGAIMLCSIVVRRRNTA